MYLRRKAIEKPGKAEVEEGKEEKKEFGSRLIDEFLEFSKVFNKEAFVTEKNGITVLKLKYRE